MLNLESYYLELVFGHYSNPELDSRVYVYFRLGEALEI